MKRHSLSENKIDDGIYACTQICINQHLMCVYIGIWNIRVECCNDQQTLLVKPQSGQQTKPKVFHDGPDGSGDLCLCGNYFTMTAHSWILIAVQKHFRTFHHFRALNYTWAYNSRKHWFGFT